MTTFGDRLYQYGGMPVDSGENPIFGKVWFVDGTNGSANNGGRKPDDAYATVQQAITAQIADTSSLGDVIYVMPGTYTETVTASAFTKLQLIGATCGGEPRAVRMQSATGHALSVGADATVTASLVNSAIRNIAFLTPSGGTRAKAALIVSTMQMSIIDNCKFLGVYSAGAGSVTTVGLQLGCYTDTAASYHEFGTISNCEFGANGPRTWEVDTGIRVGAATVATPASTGFKSMKIINNIIATHHSGINLGVGAASCGGTLIARNTIHSHQGGGGSTVGIQSRATDGTDLLCMIYDNRVSAIDKPIYNFSASNIMGNIISDDSGTPKGWYGYNQTET